MFCYITAPDCSWAAPGGLGNLYNFCIMVVFMEQLEFWTGATIAQVESLEKGDI